MEPKDVRELTKEQQKEALAYLMFIKQKQCGKIKACRCADGCKQWAYTPAEETSSPTVATEAVFLTAVIDAYEGREVAIVDITGTFMQADMDEDVFM